MGYDYKVTKGNELTVSVCIYHNGVPKERKFKLPVSKGDEIYYEFYIKDGNIEGR